MKPETAVMDAADMRKRLDAVEKALQDILSGGKPFIDPANTDTAWLYEQLTRMRAGHFVSEIAKSYVRLPGEGDAVMPLKGDTRHHSFGHTLLREVKNLRNWAEQDGIRNYKVFGADYGHRLPGADPLEQLGDAGSFVLTPGDVVSLRQFVAFLKAKPGGKTIIVQNEDGFWDPMIAALDLDRAGSPVKISSDAEETAAILSQQRDFGKGALSSPRTHRVRPGATVLLATSNNKKVHELDEVLEAANAHVRVMPFASFVGRPKEAEEISRSSTGNNYEKLESVRDMILQEGLAAIKAEMEARGIDPETVDVWFDDRAIELAEDYFRTAIFDDCREILNDYKPGPGAELANVLKRVPLKTMYNRLAQAAAALLEQNGRALNTNAEDIQVYTVMKLVQKDYAHPEYYCFHSIRDNTLHFTPALAPGEANAYSENYMSIRRNNPDRLRNSEIGNYLVKHSPMARAAEVAAYVFGMDVHRDGVDLNSQFNKVAERRIVGATLSTPGNARSENAAWRVAGFDKAGKNELNGGNGISNWVLRYGAFAKKAAGFIWKKDHDADAAKDPVGFWQHFYQFYKLIVEVQVFNPDMHGKPVVVQHEPGKRTCAPEIDIYNHLHQLGFIGDKPQHMFTETSSDAESAAVFKQAFDRFIPNRSSIDGIEEAGMDRDDLYKVTVYSSATNEAQDLSLAIRQLHRCMAATGFGAQNGGGAKGGMAASSRGVLEARDWWKGREQRYGAMPVNHLAGITCTDTARSEGVFEGCDYEAVHPTLESREFRLRQTQAEVAAPGGAGTVREIAGSIVSRLMGIDTVENRPLILFNADYHGTRIYDPLIKLLPDTLRSKLNIHVADRWQDAFVTLVEQRRAAGLEPKGINWAVLNDDFFGLTPDDLRRLNAAPDKSAAPSPAHP
jgi:predicted Rossmann-fold nucleotide-binding protein